VTSSRVAGCATLLRTADVVYMEDISEYIKHHLIQLRPSCPSYNATNLECTRSGGCVCYKTAEVFANIRSLIPQEYRNATIYDYTGRAKGSKKRVLTANEAVNIRNQLWGYMYEGEMDQSVTSMKRSELNERSILDTRFRKGTNLVIHGDQKSIKSSEGYEHASFAYSREPKGKTLLASCVMIDAIWRRTSAQNQARTYDWISFLQLRQALKKGRDLSDAQDADWLVIDDICKIEKSNSSSWTKETIDDFITSRSHDGKPTILIFDFDVDKVSLSDTMGTGIAKIVESSNTYRIKV
jgi:hypothetical protein